MRKQLAVFIISGCVLLLAGACGTEDLTGSEPTATWDDVVKTRVAQRQNQPTRTPIPTSTPFARLTPTVIGTAGPTPTPTPTFTPEPTPTPNAISAELAPVLLAVEDLPTGWRVSEVSSEIPLTATDNVCGVPVQDPAVAELASGYEGGASGPFAEEYLSLYSSGQNAAAVLEQLQLAFNACPPEGFDYGDGTSGFISPISFPPVGDGSFGVRLGVGVEDLVIEFDMVVFRVDEVLVTVLYQDSAELFGRPPDPAAFEALVRNAEARIHAHTELIDGISAPAQSL